jgi:uncharacterized protein (DUF1330 family)
MANIKVHDFQEYQKYLDGAEEVFSRFNGTYLAVDSQPEVLEGSWDYSRVVLIRFENKEDLKAWYGSGEYQEILKYRLSASHCDSLLVHGK